MCKQPEFKGKVIKKYFDNKADYYFDVSKEGIPKARAYAVLHNIPYIENEEGLFVRTKGTRRKLITILSK